MLEAENVGRRHRKMLATTDARERMAASQSAGLKPQPGRDAWGLYRC